MTESQSLDYGSAYISHDVNAAVETNGIITYYCCESDPTGYPLINVKWQEQEHNCKELGNTDNMITPEPIIKPITVYDLLISIGFWVFDYVIERVDDTNGNPFAATLRTYVKKPYNGRHYGDIPTDCTLFLDMGWNGDVLYTTGTANEVAIDYKKYVRPTTGICLPDDWWRRCRLLRSNF